MNDNDYDDNGENNYYDYYKYHRDDDVDYYNFDENNIHKDDGKCRANVDVLATFNPVSMLAINVYFVVRDRQSLSYRPPLEVNIYSRLKCHINLCLCQR